MAVLVTGWCVSSQMLRLPLLLRGLLTLLLLLFAAAVAAAAVKEATGLSWGMLLLLLLSLPQPLLLLLLQAPSQQPLQHSLLGTLLPPLLLLKTLPLLMAMGLG